MSAKRVWSCTANIDAWVKFGAALAHDDVAADDALAAEALHAQTLTS